MTPPPAALMIGRACLMPRNGPLTFTAIMASKDSTGISSMFFLTLMPALFTRTSRRPVRSSTAASAAFQLSSEVTSSGRKTAPMDAAVFSPFRAVRIGHEHRGAFLPESSGDLRADPSRGARDQGGLARKTHRAHFAPPFADLDPASFS
jgi:hypothetical protein